MIYVTGRNDLYSCLVASAIVMASTEIARADEPDAISADASSAAASVTPYLYVAAELFSNLSGGLDTGTSGLGLIEAGFDVDLDRLVGWSGASFHVSGLLAGGEDPSVNVGDFNTLSNIAAPDGLFFYEAWLEMLFRDDRARLKFGQMTVDGDFMGSEYGGLFVNSGFGILNTFSGNAGVPTYPLGGLGVLLQYTWPEATYVQFAVYDGDAGSDQRHGVDYRFNDEEGAVIVYEAGTDGFMLGDRPGTYKFGGYYHTGEFTDFRDGSTVEGHYSFYIVADQVLLQLSPDTPKLAGFLRAAYNPQVERNTVSFYAEVGINLFTPLPERDEDVAGVGLFYTDFSDDAVRDLRLTEPHVNGSESVLEIFYQAQITPWLSIKPEFQFIFDPMLAEDDAILFGTRIEITL